MTETKYTFTVEVDFDADSSYTDISTDVREIHTESGYSNDQLAHVAQIGTLRLLLNNSSGNYSPDNTGGTYYGQQWINAPVRVSIAGPTVIWFGYIRSVRPVPGVYGGQACELWADDLLGHYAQSQIAITAQENLTMAETLNLIGSEVFKSDRATGTVTFSAVPDEDDQITVADRTYTLKTTVSSTEYEVLIGENVTNMARNLTAAINDDPDAASGNQLYGDNTLKSRQVSASFLAGVVTVKALNRGTLGNSIGLSTKAPHRDADSVTVVVSDGSSGTVTNTHTENQVYFQVEEVGGSAPAFAFYFDFVISGTGQTVVVVGRYAGGSGHTVYVQAYNWGATAYEILGTMPESGADAEYQFALTSGHTDGSGNVRIRFYHSSIGNATHFIRIDHLNIVANVAQTPSDIALSGSTLSGGADGPSGMTDYDTGLRTFDIAGDQWSEERTNALRAVQDVAESEFGYIWVSRAGNLVARDKNFEFELPSQVPGDTLGNETFAFDAEYGDDIFNRATVNFQPRGTASTGVIAKANNVLAIPGKTTGTRWNRDTGYPGSGEAASLAGGTKVVRLPFVEGSTGNIVGATDVITPRRATDFSINDSRDLLGFDYTNYTPPFIRVAIVVTGSGVECAFTNIALDTLYLSDFQVRGTAIISYDPQQIIRENSTSIGKYQVSGVTYNIPLPSGENFAEQIAFYLVNRYADPEYRVHSATVRAGRFSLGAAGPAALSVDIGDLLGVAETQTGIDHQYYVRSIKMDAYGVDTAQGPQVELIYGLKRIDANTYWILGDATYGVLNTTTRLAL